MTIRLTPTSEELTRLDLLSPREIVAELDRHVVGQAAAKRAVAIALRNRIRGAHLKNGVRHAFPRFADGVATAHRRLNRARRALPTGSARG